MVRTRAQSDVTSQSGRQSQRPLVGLAPADRSLVTRVATADQQNDVEDTEASARETVGTEAQPSKQRARRFPRGLRRLRDRLQTLEDRLRLDVNGLRQDIADLNVQRQILETKSNVERKLLLQKSVEVVVEYFGAFQHGWILTKTPPDSELAAPDLAGDSSLVMTRTPRQAQERVAFLRQRQQLLVDRQEHFVKTALAPAMQFGHFDTNGVEEFVDEWKKFSAWHQSPRLTLTCISCHGSAEEPIILAIGTFSGKLTLNALQSRYPQAMQDSRFVKRLVGSSIRYPSREVFHFDSTGLITRYDRGLDYVSSFACLLDSLEDVARVLQDAVLVDGGGIERIQTIVERSIAVAHIDFTEKDPTSTAHHVIQQEASGEVEEEIISL